jgi:hypothetical protein
VFMQCLFEVVCETPGPGWIITWDNLGAEGSDFIIIIGGTGRVNREIRLH